MKLLNPNLERQLRDHLSEDLRDADCEDLQREAHARKAAYLLSMLDIAKAHQKRKRDP